MIYQYKIQRAFYFIILLTSEGYIGNNHNISYNLIWKLYEEQKKVEAYVCTVNIVIIMKK